MSTERAISRHDSNGVSEIVMSLPTRMNSFRAEYVRELAIELEAARKAESRCIVIRGAADCFSAGWDLSAMQMDGDDPFQIINQIVGPFCKLLRELAVPTISAVNGPALGFGLGLALSCDICIASEDATLGSPFRNIGMIPDTGAHFYLLERLGVNRALDLIYTGKMLTGSQAAAAGLINQSVTSGTVNTEALKLATNIAAGPTQAFRLSKQLLLAGGDYETMMQAEAIAQTEVFATLDAREGVHAFQERRKPKFVGK